MIISHGVPATTKSAAHDSASMSETAESSGIAIDAVANASAVIAVGAMIVALSISEAKGRPVVGDIV